MHGVTCFKLGSLILPTSLKTDIFVIYLYVHYLTFSQTNRKYWKRRHFSSIVYPIGDTSIDGDPSIKELWLPFKVDGEPVTCIPGDSRTDISNVDVIE